MAYILSNCISLHQKKKNGRTNRKLTNLLPCLWAALKLIEKRCCAFNSYQRNRIAAKQTSRSRDKADLVTVRMRVFKASVQIFVCLRVVKKFIYPEFPWDFTSKPESDDTSLTCLQLCSYPSDMSGWQTWHLFGFWFIFILELIVTSSMWYMVA